MHESLGERRIVVRHGAWSVAPAMLALAVVGCGGPGQTIPLSVNMDAVPAPAKVTAPLRVAVLPFEDGRTDKSRIGRYQHYVETTVDTLVPAGGSAPPWTRWCLLADRRPIRSRTSSWST